jgi:hypothetical protein
LEPLTQVKRSDARDFSRAIAMDRYRYRAYVLNRDDSIRLAIDLYCADDETARERAQQLVDGHDIELWRGTRKIARLSHRKHHAGPEGEA